METDAPTKGNFNDALLPTTYDTKSSYKSSYNRALFLEMAVDFMFEKLMQALPSDAAKLFFLQSEISKPEFKHYNREEKYIVDSLDYKYAYYIKVKSKLNQLKEQCEQTRL